MSKRDNEGDVLANRLSLGLAKNQKLLASWMGTQPDAQPTNDIVKTEEEDHELKQDFFGHDRLGVGGVLPKEIADGSFTRRTITSNDKLLEQLIGKKKAKAHIAAKLQAERSGAQPQSRPGKREVAKKEESDDEEEGRAATFKSKRRKVAKTNPVPASDDEGDLEQDALKEAAQDKPIQGEVQPQPTEELLPTKKFYDDVELEPAVKKKKAIPSRGKAKPTSYLDELLAERSKKKQNKNKNKNKIATEA
ncbi:hypothetical protein HBI56_109420 [Parastagonospora nodorum]|nr:hypothetical protein HBH98_060340 [Parastagonospora nodorum]KAH4395132.1 hypothetical protein HBH97_028160 [Parastagonospora nodorum]KAH4418248.1 hypothetical protein HBH99_057640 [Parastagonospora nodorum]KAH4904172.1 hypothetical protein HBI80_113850 [Parastagonospora nodorum]KAH4967476.1 hypothetical protein HBI78_070090 [Parastagonospora nodorum]